MVSILPYLLPMALAVVISIWFIRWVGLRRRAPLAPMPKRVERRMGRADWIAMGIVTVCYGFLAFLNLGSTEAPQSFCHFEDWGTTVTISFDDETELSGLRYYCGLNTGNYYIDVSADGETWTRILNADDSTPMPQSYTLLFRWNEAVWDTTEPVKYLCITSDCELWLGEVVLLDADGCAIDPSHFSTDGAELFDEQDTVPASYSYLNGTYFDEIYHARTAYEHLQGAWPYEITHPPLGKLIIGLGIRLFGMTPFGWRFSGTLFGVLMVPVMYIFLKKLFGSFAAAYAGTTVFAFDFMHFAQTRIATIDTYAVFFLLLMYLFMYCWLTETDGRRQLLWLGLCGLSFGLGAASKWTVLYGGAGLAVIWLGVWLVRLLRREGRASFGSFVKNALWCCLFFVVIPALIYYFSYASYAPSQGIKGPFSRGYLQLVLNNQSYMFNYHSKLVAEHSFSSSWYQWLVDARPILYYADYGADGTRSTISSFNSPLLCWAGLLSLGGCVWLSLRGDRRAMFITVAYAANLIPWLAVSRLTFAYHYFPCSAFLVLAIGLVFAEYDRLRPRAELATTGFACLAVVLFAMFYPVLSGLRCSGSYVDTVLRWFSSWSI